MPSTPRNQKHYRASCPPWLLYLALPLCVACAKKNDTKPEGGSYRQIDTRPTPLQNPEVPVTPTGSVLSLDASEISALSSFDHKAWVLLAEQITKEPAPAPSLMEALWKESQKPGRWISELSSAMRDAESGLSIQDSRLKAASWLLLSLTKAFGGTHQAQRTFAIASAEVIGLELQAVQKLQSRAEGDAWLATEQGQIAIIVANAGIYEEKFDLAYSTVQSAIETRKNLADTRLRNTAERILVVVHIHKGEWAKAAELSKTALAKKIRFPTPSPYGSSYSRDPYERAVEEIGEVARWASVLTPEWIRALGVLAATAQDKALKHLFLTNFTSGLLGLRNTEYGADDLQVVIRQLKERGYDAMAMRADAIGKGQP